MSASARPCKVDLCPALALEDDNYCATHRTAKKLHQAAAGLRCGECGREIHAGAYVTLGSTPLRAIHAVCPKDRPRVTAPPKGETPLFDEPAGAARA